MDNALACSVIIPTYNRMELLGHTLESLTGQSLPTDTFEVLVVDDGSSDATSSMVDKYRDRLNLRYFFQSDEGFRVAQARNVGIAHARADVCVFVDSGMLLHSGCLAAHVASHTGAEGPVAVCGYVYCFTMDDAEAALISARIDIDDPDATISSLEREGRWLDIREHFYARYTDDFHDLPAPWVIYWTCNVSAATAQLRSVGMFDEAFRSWGAEDLDLAYRLHRDGARIVLNRAASAVHCPHDKSLTRSLASVVDNYRYMASKYRTPVMDRLAADPTVNIFEFNELVGNPSGGR